MSTSKSYFKNWHRHNHGNVKSNDLSELHPVKAKNIHGGGLELEFEDPYGKRIAFILSPEDAIIIRKLNFKS